VDTLLTVLDEEHVFQPTKAQTRELA